MTTMPEPNLLKQLACLSREIKAWREDDEAGYDAAIELLYRSETLLQEAFAALAIARAMELVR